MAINRAFETFEEIPLDDRKKFGSFILNTSRIHRWTMLRTWVNSTIVRDVSNTLNSSSEENVHTIPRLNLPPNCLTTTLLQDPNTMKNGHKFQEKFGAKYELEEGQVGVLPDNIYFVYGIPRARFASVATVTSRLQESNTPAQGTSGKPFDDHNSDDESLRLYGRYLPQ